MKNKRADMSNSFKKQYNKDLDLFMCKYKDDTRFEISLKSIINKPLNKELKYHCLIPVFLFLCISLLMVIFVCSFNYIALHTNDKLIQIVFVLLNIIGSPLIFMTIVIFTEKYYKINAFDFFNILKSRKSLIKKEFNSQKATPELIRIVEESCKKDNKDVIMYELMNNGTKEWYPGTNGRLKGFYYRELSDDYEFAYKSSRMSNDVKKSINELYSAKKAWDEKQMIMNNVNIENTDNVKETKKRL